MCSHRIVVGVLVVGVLLGLAPAAHGQKDRKKAVDVIIVSIKVETTKSGGAAWDAGGGAPDLKVFVRKDKGFDKGTATKTKENTFEAKFDQKTIRIEEGDTIEIVVYDEDVAGDDTVGTYRKTITADTIREGVVRWKFDRVIELQVKFEP